LIKSIAKGTKEQERLIKLIPRPGEWFTNESQAKRKINELMEWVQQQQDTNAEALDIDPSTLPRWQPLEINPEQEAHDSKVEEAVDYFLKPGQ
jgi:hypothetical protein